MSHISSASLGFPRIGGNRELKKALENYWGGKTDAAELLNTAQDLRARHWALQAEAGITHIPSNDFSLYDHVLDAAYIVGAIPARFGTVDNGFDPDVYFAVARGNDATPALPLRKWFDTNYHFIVPEFSANQEFALAWRKPIDEFLEAKAQGIVTRPVLIGPVTLLSLGRTDNYDPLTLLERLLPVYSEILLELQNAGAEWIQIDEPVLCTDLDDASRAALQQTYDDFAALIPGLKICLTSYFDRLGDNAELALGLPVAAVHLDLVRAPDQLAEILPHVPDSLSLSLGVVDGRNIWRNNLRKSHALIKTAADQLGQDRIIVGPSCSLLHSPVDLNGEQQLDREIRTWLSFGKQKLGEIVLLTRAAGEGPNAIAEALANSDAAVAARQSSPRIHDPHVAVRQNAITPDLLTRHSSADIRKEKQRAALDLPLFPATTIGSFPQTAEVRKARAAFNKGNLSAADYDTFIKSETAEAIRFQERIGLDVLVHGEFERTDMVEYFGANLQGFAFTENGWVQSFGSRCVKPPIIYGDVARPAPITVALSEYAQSLTPKPVKGMLTGPVTILQWSFVRDDQPRAITCQQIALAMRDEVKDLEAAGIPIIQIDEPALREGLPLRVADQADYLRWAVDAFRLTASCVQDTTQIHSHFCYSDFGKTIGPIAAMDADVISIEMARSGADLLQVFAAHPEFKSDIGPGVYDIHSPRIPATAEIANLLRNATAILPPDRIWVNPDCGLKTRGWPEVCAALQTMATVAAALRSLPAADQSLTL